MRKRLRFVAQTLSDSRCSEGFSGFTSLPWRTKMRGRSKASGRLVAAGLSGLGLAIFVAAPARAALIESFENTLDGWQVPSPFGSAAQQANFQSNGFSATGATNGSTSLAIGATATNTSSGPDYSQMMISPAQATTYGTNLTTLLQNASAVNIDILAPGGSFGGFLQFDIDIDNAATGFTSLDSFSYPSTSIGSEKTISVPVTAAQRAALAGSGAGTRMIIQVGGGYTSGNETFFIDNITTTEVPEPASIGAVAGVMLLTLRRRRTAGAESH
jgi:hypothetical protein